MIQMRMKMLFFDSPGVQRAMDAASRAPLSRAGAFIRKRKTISQPGQPPHSHAGHLRRLIFLA